MKSQNSNSHGGEPEPRKPAFAWPQFETIRQAAAMLGWSESFLKRLKRAGAPGFRSGRVYLADLIPWLGTQDGEGDDWGEVLKKEKALRERIKRNVEERSVVPCQLVRSELGRARGAVDKLLTVKLENEYPALVAGLDIPSCRIKGRQLGDSIRDEWNKVMATLPPLPDSVKAK